MGPSRSGPYQVTIVLGGGTRGARSGRPTNHCKGIEPVNSWVRPTEGALNHILAVNSARISCEGGAAADAATR
jgi:hypothetical protein